MICSLLLHLKASFFNSQIRSKLRCLISKNTISLTTTSVIEIAFFIISLQFFPTADEAIEYYNKKRCVDGKALILPSQIVSLLITSMSLSFTS